MSVVFQCEINPFCREVLRKHWPHTKLAGDISKVTAKEIPRSNVWCGGFPCQDLSLANQGKRQGLQGSRSGLFFKFAELLSIKRPRWVIIENVPGLLNSHGGEDFKVLIQTLDELGYGVSWRILDAKHFGTPQRRRRVYIVASYKTMLSAEVLFEQPGTAVPNQSSGCEEQNATEGSKGLSRASNTYTIQHAGIGRKHTAGPQAKGFRCDGEAYTLDSRGASDAICKTDDAFGIRDSAGLPGGLDSNRFRAIGNAVAVPVVEWIGARLLAVNGNFYK